MHSSLWALVFSTKEHRNNFPPCCNTDKPVSSEFSRQTWHTYAMASCMFQLLTLLHGAFVYKIHIQEFHNQVMRKTQNERAHVVLCKLGFCASRIRIQDQNFQALCGLQATSWTCMVGLSGERTKNLDKKQGLSIHFLPGNGEAREPCTFRSLGKMPTNLLLGIL